MLVSVTLKVSGRPELVLMASFPDFVISAGVGNVKSMD